MVSGPGGDLGSDDPGEPLGNETSANTDFFVCNYACLGVEN